MPGIYSAKRSRYRHSKIDSNLWPDYENGRQQSRQSVYKMCIEKKNIVLKSEGKQYYSFMYVPDSVSGLLTAFFYGKKGEAYNIAEENHDCTLKEIAAIIADIAGTEIEYQLPNTVEASGYSKATKARLNGHKLMALGWKPYFDLRSGLERTIRILKS